MYLRGWKVIKRAPKYSLDHIIRISPCLVIILSSFIESFSRQSIDDLNTYRHNFNFVMKFNINVISFIQVHFIITLVLFIYSYTKGPCVKNDSSAGIVFLYVKVSYTWENRGHTHPLYLSQRRKVRNTRVLDSLYSRFLILLVQS